MDVCVVENVANKPRERARGSHEKSTRISFTRSEAFLHLAFIKQEGSFSKQSEPDQEET
jgi:hypothetical protein